MMFEIAVLITCHNRKSKTIDCLNALFMCFVPNNFTLKVFLVDDGSTDGTSEAIKTNFPNVIIIEGNGNLYWNRGMYKAWEKASSLKNYDYYFWLNDDTILFENAFDILLNSAKKTNNNAIICGSTLDLNNKISYGGMSKINFGLIQPNNELQECEIIHGNCVLVPNIIFNKIGNLDWTFRHAIGDFDYGLRAQKAGFKCYIAPEYVGNCESNPTLPKWCLPETPILKRFKLLYSPLGYAEPLPFFIYEKRHFGLISAIKHFISINLRALIPSIWK